MDLNLFSRQTYIDRRKSLMNNVGSGLIIIPGNPEAPMNYKDNTYRFRQDSCLLYYTGLSIPDLVLCMDADSGESVLLGHEYTMDDIIWIGPHPSLNQMAEAVGITTVREVTRLKEIIAGAADANRTIHLIPPYRQKHLLEFSVLLRSVDLSVEECISKKLIESIVRQRSVKTPEEIIEMTDAVNISRDMHLAAMQATRPGIKEYEVVAAIMEAAMRKGSHTSYPIIFSVNGQVLHNHAHSNTIQAGQLALNDSGAENRMGYAGDITRTFPASGKFTTKQKEIYDIVLEMEESSIEALKPGVLYRDIHVASNRIMLERLKSLGLLHGDVDEMLAAGVGGLFMPHGLGHMIGLDVHDMENLGENFVGYRPGLERSTQLGLKSLRLARELEAGFVLTVEPGVYFIPELIEKWKSEHKFTQFIHYEGLKAYYDFGGIRIEDNVLITNNGHEILGKPIPKTTADVESVMNP